MSNMRDRSDFVPNGCNAVTPRIVARESVGLIEFLKAVFAATGEHHTDRPSVINIGDSMIMVSESGIREPVRGFLYVYVADTDGAYRRAIGAGARSLEPPTDMPYGDRRAIVEDVWGNIWQIATYGGNP
jgi:PhnB protein